jgi:hypothetical protein
MYDINTFSKSICIDTTWVDAPAFVCHLGGTEAGLPVPYLAAYHTLWVSMVTEY